MTRLVVLGAGGHAKVVADMAGLLGHEVTAYVDEDGSRLASDIHGITVVGGLDDVRDLPVALGIGDNQARLRRYQHLVGDGRQVMTLVHPSAILASTVALGAGTVVMAGVVVNSDTSVGAAVVLNTACSVDHDCDLADGVHVAPGSRLAGGVSVGTGALVGIGSSIVPLRQVGDWAVCGAGSVVVGDVPDGCTVKGVPARGRRRRRRI